MKLNEHHKYHDGYFHIIQLEGGSATFIYLVVKQSKIDPSFKLYLKSFTRRDEAVEYIHKLVGEDDN